MINQPLMSYKLENATGINQPSHCIISNLNTAFSKGKAFICLVLSLTLLQALPSYVSAQSNDCEELICNTNLQFSLNSMCQGNYSADQFIENPNEGLKYEIRFYDDRGSEITTFSAQDVDKEYSYVISCNSNSCSGTLIIEANQFPNLLTPCALREDGNINPECYFWCSQLLPSVLLSVEEVTALFDNDCGPEIVGKLDEVITKTGNICSPDGEVTTVSYSGKFLLHGELRHRNVLTQRYVRQRLDINALTADAPSKLLFPEDIQLNCDQSSEPDSIVRYAGNDYRAAYPVLLDVHSEIPDSSERCDTFQIEEFLSFRDTTVQVTTPSGELIWEKITLVDKSFEDSIVCGLLPVIDANGDIVTSPAKVPLTEKFCNLLTSYSDLEFEACSNGIKIVRTWTIIDWCDDIAELSGSQIIEMTDTEKPVILSEIQDMVVSVDPWLCSAIAKLPELQVKDNCGQVSIAYLAEEGTVQDGFITDLWLSQDSILVLILVSDGCENTDTLDFTVKITDTTAPVVVCNAALQISLTAGANASEDGVAKLLAKDFDEGSHDYDCGNVVMTVIRKEDWTNAIKNCDGLIVGYEPQSCFVDTEEIDLGYSGTRRCEYSGDNKKSIVSRPAEFIKFCCEDAGTIVEVILIATDEAGNVSQCEAEVIVQNRNGPELICEDIEISCLSDMPAIGAPELIEGSVCAVGNANLKIGSEYIDNSDCDLIQVTRTWYADGNANGEIDEGEPRCAQHITVRESRQNVSLSCLPVSMSCTSSLEDLVPPEIIANQYCGCGDSLIKIASTRRSAPSCVTDTLSVDWYIDFDGDEQLGFDEPSCTQQVFLLNNAENNSLVCPAITIECDENLLSVERPTIVSTAESCICTDDFLRIASEERMGGECTTDVVVREWYLDSNLNNILDGTESSCIQNITIDYSQVSYSLNCSTLTISCDEDINQVALPVIIATGSCDCEQPTLLLTNEEIESDFCSDSSIQRNYVLDVNDNGIQDADEPTCTQLIRINNDVQAVQLDCRDGLISCVEEVDDFLLPTIDNPNECVCEGTELILSNQSALTNLCDGDVIIKEWYVDINQDGSQNEAEPTCVQNLTITINTSTDPNDIDSISLLCSEQTATCTADLDNIAVPILVTEGICECGDVNILLRNQSDLSEICSGDVIIREYYADLNDNGIFDDQEATCVQRINIIGEVSYDLSCQMQVISCFSQIENIEPPQVLNDGFCECAAPSVRLFETSVSDQLCEGDTIRQQWYLDLDEDQTFDSGEPTCVQLAVIDGNPFMATLNCGVINISCQDNLDDFQPEVMTNQGICTCPLDLEIVLRDEVDMGSRCVGDTLSRSWYIDLNRNATLDPDEPTCEQTFIIMFDDILTLSCTNYTALCSDEIPDNANPPTLLQSGNCACADVDIRLLEETGAEERCAGDTLSRLWYADINRNLTLDDDEPSCSQLIFLQDVPSEVMLSCSDVTINCSTAMDDIPTPMLEGEAACGCSDYSLVLLTDGSSEDLCFGDSFARTWYVDANGNGIAESGELNCTQTITIQADLSAMQLVCEEQTLSCTDSISSLLPPGVSENGICSCEGVVAEPLMVEIDPALCEGDTLYQTWYIDLNESDTFDESDLSCEQAVIIQTDPAQLVNSLSLSCINYAVGCADDLSDTLNTPSLTGSDLCGCLDITIILNEEMGGEDRCVGDVISREWYADLNNNGSVDAGEPSCIQLITIEDVAADFTLSCPDIVINCSTALDSITRPTVNSNSACGCMEAELKLLLDGSMSGVCFGDEFTREWYVDVNQDQEFQEGEARCTQNITIQESSNDMVLECAPLLISCTDTLSQIAPPTLNAGGICSCDQVQVVLADVSIGGSVCIGDTIIQTWYVDSNDNQSFENNELSCDQLLIVTIDTTQVETSFVLECMDYSIACTDSLELNMNVPALADLGFCNCTDIAVLLNEESGGVDRCVGDVIVREWYGDLNQNAILDAGEPVCNQMITLEDVDAEISLICDEVFVTCSVERDSIPLPEIMSSSSCGCMDFSLTLISDGSGGGICFGESFIRDFYIDTNGDGIPQSDEPTCDQRVTVQGSMEEMAFLCEPVTISCSDTLANVPPPELNIQGICTCGQVDIELASVSIEGSICSGDTIVQTWYVDVNASGDFDSDDLSCEQLLIVEDLPVAAFICEDIPITCDVIIEEVPPPAIIGEGFCNCSDLQTYLVDGVLPTDDLCIGDVIEREWFLDIDGDEAQGVTEPTCIQSLVVLGDDTDIGFMCDTFMVSCTFDIATLPIPVMSQMDDCICSDFDILLVGDMAQDYLCSGDTTRVGYYLDINDDGVYSDSTEPTCNHIVIINDSIPAFDPTSIKWPKYFTGGSIRGTNIICVEGEVLENETFIQMADAFTCMPEDLESRPFWCESECGLVTYSVTQDTVETIDACFKLVNQFTVIDWCTYDPSVTDTLERGNDTYTAISDTAQGECLNCPETGPAIMDSIYFIFDRVELDGVYTFSQEIDVEDDDPPVITVMVDTVRIDLALLDTDGDCMASTTVTAEAMDMCNESVTTPDMILWTIRVVDKDRNVIPDSAGNQVTTGTGALVSIDSRAGTVSDTFTIIWTVRDACNTASVRETKVLFSDSSGSCMPSNSDDNGLIAGQITTDLGDHIQGAMVKLNGIQANYPDSLMTNLAGKYAFTSNEMYYNYGVSVEKNDDFLNGLSTLDIILIYNHIASITAFESPYKYLAADINNDQKVSLADVVELKKLILGKIAQLENNSSWRFITKGQSFFNDTDPWPFVERISVIDLSHDMMDQDFMGVKIGDISGDAAPNDKQLVEVRSTGQQSFSIDDRYLESGKRYSMTVSADNLQDSRGFQSTLRIEDASVIKIKALSMPISEEDYHIDGELISLSYVNDAAQDLNGLLFEIQFIAGHSDWLSNSLSVVSQLVDSQIYMGSELNIERLLINVDKDQDKSESILYQNQPNPFYDQAIIHFSIPSSGEVQFKFMDVNGRLLYSARDEYTAGEHQLLITHEMFNYSGIIYYSMSNGTSTHTRKMVSIK